MEYTPPGTNPDESMFYKDLLASVTTNMDGVANRSFNVARAAEFCNGKVIQPFPWRQSPRPPQPPGSSPSAHR